MYPFAVALGAIWREWQGGGFRDDSLASTIAVRTGVLIAAPGLASPSWKPRFSAGV
jgi:hypothetical protein